MLQETLSKKNVIANDIIVGRPANSMAICMNNFNEPFGALGLKVDIVKFEWEVIRIWVLGVKIDRILR